MKKLLFILSLFVFHFSFVTSAKPVSLQTAQRVAETLLHKPVVDCTPSSYAECYLFAGADGEGFALIAADDCVRPVLGYSSTGVFPTEGLPRHIAAWIDAYRTAIAEASSQSLSCSAAQSLHDEWLSFGRGKYRTVHDTAVGPLMTTTWNQAPYYNEHCPGGSVTGCVATAMAQVMKYWNHPSVGRGSHSYTPDGYGTQSARFDTTHYLWNYMPNSLRWNSSDTELFAVAQLMHHVGIAVEMSYSPESSGAFVPSYGDPSMACSENALKNYFRYNQGLFGAQRDGYTYAQWDSLLTAELDASRPVLYSGNDGDGGHAFVLDGYDSLGYYHVNWGWGGFCDGYYTFDTLSPTASGIGGNASNSYSNNCWALLHVYPATEPVTATVSVVSADTLMGTVSGGGTFSTYTPTTILATAADGYRFLSWTSCNHYNPFYIAPNEDFVDTAVFVPILGDTVGYCTDVNVKLWGEYGNTPPEWGIRLPASAFHEHRQISAVQIYGIPEAVYTINVYRGNNLNRLMSTGTLRTSGYQWYTYTLSRPVALTDAQPIWITVTSSSWLNPATASSYSGNPNGSWYKRNGTTWEHLEDRDEYYSWMIRAVAEPLAPVEVNALAANPEGGSVTGGGSYYPGDTAVLTAIPAQGYKFVGWSTGDTANPLHYHVSTAMTVMATFIPNVGIDEVDADQLQGPAILYDIQGHQIAILSPDHQITQPLPSGVYFLRNGVSVKKIVVISK